MRDIGFDEIAGAVAQMCTAACCSLPQDVLERAAERIMAEAPGVYRVVFDVTPVPPAAIEWE